MNKIKTEDGYIFSNLDYSIPVTDRGEVNLAKVAEQFGIEGFENVDSINIREAIGETKEHYLLNTYLRNIHASLNKNGLNPLYYYTEEDVPIEEEEEEEEDYEYDIDILEERRRLPGTPTFTSTRITRRNSFGPQPTAQPTRRRGSLDRLTGAPPSRTERPIINIPAEKMTIQTLNRPKLPDRPKIKKSSPFAPTIEEVYYSYNSFRAGAITFNYYIYRILQNEPITIKSLHKSTGSTSVIDYNTLYYVDRHNKRDHLFVPYLILAMFTSGKLDLNTLYIEKDPVTKLIFDELYNVFHYCISIDENREYDIVRMRSLTTATTEVIKREEIVAKVRDVDYNYLGVKPKNKQPYHIIYYILNDKRFCDLLTRSIVLLNNKSNKLSYRTQSGFLDYFSIVICNVNGNIPPIDDDTFLRRIHINQNDTYAKLYRLPIVRTYKEYILRYSNRHLFNLPILDYILQNIPDIGNVFDYADVFAIVGNKPIPFIDIVSKDKKELLLSARTHSTNLNDLPKYEMSNLFVNYNLFNWDIRLKHSPDGTLISSCSLLRSLLQQVTSINSANRVKDLFPNFVPSMVKTMNMLYYRIVDNPTNMYTHTYIYPLFEVLLIDAIDNYKIDVNDIKFRYSNVPYMYTLFHLLSALSDNIEFVYRTGVASFTSNITINGKSIKGPITYALINKYQKYIDLGRLYIVFNKYIRNIFVCNPTLYCPKIITVGRTSYINMFSFIISTNPIVVDTLSKIDLLFNYPVNWISADRIEPLIDVKVRDAINFEMFANKLDYAVIVKDNEQIPLSSMEGLLPYIETIYRFGTLANCKIKLRQYLFDIAHTLPNFNINNIAFVVERTNDNVDRLFGLNQFINTFGHNVVGTTINSLYVSNGVTTPSNTFYNRYAKLFVSSNTYTKYDNEGNVSVRVNNDSKYIEAANDILFSKPNDAITVSKYIHTLLTILDRPLHTYSVFVPAAGRSFPFYRALTRAAYKSRSVNINDIYCKEGDELIPIILVWLRWVSLPTTCKVVYSPSSKRTNVQISNVISSNEAYNKYIQTNNIEDTYIIDDSGNEISIVEAMLDDDSFPTDYYQRIVIRSEIDIRADIDTPNYQGDIGRSNLTSLYKAAYNRISLVNDNSLVQKIFNMTNWGKPKSIASSFYSHFVNWRLYMSRVESSKKIIEEPIAVFAFTEGLVNLDNIFRHNAIDSNPSEQVTFIVNGNHTSVMDDLNEAYNIDEIIEELLNYYSIDPAENDLPPEVISLSNTLTTPFTQTMNRLMLDNKTSFITSTGYINELAVKYTDDKVDTKMYAIPDWSIDDTITNDSLLHGRATPSFIVLFNLIKQRGLQFDIYSSDVMVDVLTPYRYPEIEEANTTEINYYIKPTSLAQRLAELAALTEYIPSVNHLIYVKYNAGEVPQTSIKDVPTSVTIDTNNLVIRYWLELAKERYESVTFATLDGLNEPDIQYTLDDLLTGINIPYDDLYVIDESMSMVIKMIDTLDLRLGIYEETDYLHLIPHLILFGGIPFEKICSRETDSGTEYAMLYYNEPIYFDNRGKGKWIRLVKDIFKVLPPSETFVLDFWYYKYYDNYLNRYVSVRATLDNTAKDLYKRLRFGYLVDPDMMQTFRLYIPLMESMLGCVDMDDIINVAGAFSFDNVYLVDPYYGKLTMNEAFRASDVGVSVVGTFKYNAEQLIVDMSPTTQTKEYVDENFIKPTKFPEETRELTEDEKQLVDDAM